MAGRLGLRSASLRFRAQAGSFLYDCHTRRFAPVGRGGTIANGFARLYLAQAFGVRVDEWPAFLDSCRDDLKALCPEARDEYVRAHAVKFDLSRAVEFAARVFPEASRFLRVTADESGPFVLRDEFLFQPNVPIAALEARTLDGEWRTLVDGLDSASPFTRAALTRLLAAATEHTLDDSQLSDEEAPWLAAFRSADLIAAATEVRAAPPPSRGVYFVGHSALLFRGREAGLLVDPLFASSVSVEPGRMTASDVAPLADAVALTHGHFDHYHLPTLLGLSRRPIVVPSVPRASVVCEDMAARLREWGAPDVRAPAWGESFALGDLTVHVLPFVGEQFVTAEIYPDARNWGNSYVVETAGVRVFVAADSGFEAGRSVIDVIAAWVVAHGPVDIVLAQAIALRTHFGGGDPDLMLTALTSARRAVDAIELLRPERRVTLAIEDSPL